MAQLTIDIPAGQTNRVLDAFATKYGYTGFLADGITPETKAAFAKRIVIKQIKDVVREAEAAAASKTAFDSAAAAADSEITLT